jgi:hypothetical protein
MRHILLLEKPPSTVLVENDCGIPKPVENTIRRGLR